MTLGIVIVLFVALVGLGALATAIRFAIRPTERGLAVLRPLSAATTFAALCAFLLGVATALVNVIRSWRRRWSRGHGRGLEVPRRPGRGQCLGVAFALLAVAWLLAAVGCASRLEPGPPDAPRACFQNSSILWNRWMRAGRSSIPCLRMG